MACDPPVFCTSMSDFHGYFYDPFVVFDTMGGPAFQLKQGSVPITWTITGLPPGMSPQVTNGISNIPIGTASAPGNYSVTATAVNACGSASRTVSVSIGNLLSCYGLPSVTSFSYQIVMPSPTLFNRALFITLEGCGSPHLQWLGNADQIYQNVQLLTYHGLGGLGQTSPGHDPVDRVLVFDNTGSIITRPGAIPTTFAPGNSYTLPMEFVWTDGSTLHTQPFTITVTLVNPCGYTPPPTPPHFGRRLRRRVRQNPPVSTSGNRWYPY